MRTTLIAAAMLLTAGALMCNAADPKSVGSPAPAFSLPDQNGRPVSLADFRGKIVVLQWWNEACPYIQRHAKAGTVEAMAQKYKGNDVVVLAINSTAGNTPESNLKAVGQFKLSYPILSDAAGQVGKSYGAKTTPHMFVIDKSGTIAYNGAVDNDPDGNKADRVNYVSQAIDELLAGKSLTTPESKPYGCSVKYAK